MIADDDERDWWVWSTLFNHCVLIVEDRTTEDAGIVMDPTLEEWQRAGRASAEPYPWEQSHRVVTPIPPEEMIDELRRKGFPRHQGEDE